MKCRDARELINSYLDNGLDPHNDKLLMEHVAGCSKCSEELRFLIAYRQAVHEIKPVKAPAGFIAELKKRIELEKNSSLRRLFYTALDVWHHFTFPVEAVGVIAVALLIFFLYTPLFHGVKKITTYNEEQVVTETKTKSIEEQIIEKRKLLPPAAEKKEQRERLSVSSEKDLSGAEETARDILSEKEKAPAAIDDSASFMSKESADDSIHDSDKGAGSVFRSESAKRDEAPREMKKKAVSANEISRPSAITPERIIAESGGMIIKKNRGLYTIKVSEEKLRTLAEKLKRNHSATYKITGRSGSTLTVEFRIPE